MHTAHKQREEGGVGGRGGREHPMPAVLGLAVVQTERLGIDLIQRMELARS